MIVKFLLLASCAAALVQGDVYEDEIKRLTDEASRKLLDVSGILINSKQEYLSMIQERYEALVWEHFSQKQDVNKSVSLATVKGMTRNNQFSTYQCIANVARDTLAKIQHSQNYISNATATILETGLNGVRPFRLIVPGLLDFLRGYQEAQIREVDKAKNESEKKRILERFARKMKLLQVVLEEVQKKTWENKFRFFEKYVEYAFDTETYLRRTVREGNRKLLKCVL